jgi:Flp pilus assembly pilin Flp
VACRFFYPLYVQRPVPKYLGTIVAKMESAYDPHEHRIVMVCEKERLSEMKRFLKILWIREGGQDIPEYALLLALICLALVTAVSVFGMATNKTYVNASDNFAASARPIRNSASTPNTGTIPGDSVSGGSSSWSSNAGSDTGSGPGNGHSNAGGNGNGNSGSGGQNAGSGHGHGNDKD